ncbi:selenoprotein Pa isoform X2 [Pristis pectinata]|nr:selenoprotein Pa isoform X2 [Pristis pectinata]XP_051875277.1 selenoprotein Pa isoform X2 [Pristis pectinata]
MVQAASLRRLKQKLDQKGLLNISYMVVNHQGNSSRKNYQVLKSKVQEALPVYQQEIGQPDVWTLLRGEKDDFLIYDRCGQQTFHLGLPYTDLRKRYVEHGIRQTYCQTICTNCSLSDQPPVCSARDAEEQTEAEAGNHHGHHRGHAHNSYKRARRWPLPKNRTQSEQVEHVDHQHHQHHHLQHQHTEFSASEGGVHGLHRLGDP